MQGIILRTGKTAVNKMGFFFCHFGPFIESFSVLKSAFWQALVLAV